MIKAVFSGPFFRNHNNMLLKKHFWLLSMLKTVVLHNIFLETMICFIFQDSRINRKFKRTAFMWNRNLLLLSCIWLPLTQTAHHPWTTFPIMHCTHTFPSTITPITQLSPFTHQLWLPHHTCTSFSHSHKSSTQTLTQCEVLFSPG